MFWLHIMGGKRKWEEGTEGQRGLEEKWIASLSDGARRNPTGHRSPGMERGSLLPLWGVPDTSVKHETESGLGQRKGCHGYLRTLNKGLLVFHLHPVPLSTAVKLSLGYSGVHGVHGL